MKFIALIGISVWLSAALAAPVEEATPVSYSVQARFRSSNNPSHLQVSATVVDPLITPRPIIGGVGPVVVRSQPFFTFDRALKTYLDSARNVTLNLKRGKKRRQSSKGKQWFLTIKLNRSSSMSP
jgi:hypothetical protein